MPNNQNYFVIHQHKYYVKLIMKLVKKNKINNEQNNLSSRKVFRRENFEKNSHLSVDQFNNKL
jgi:hypothetical protein